jgi:hypothetical protein
MGRTGRRGKKWGGVYAAYQEKKRQDEIFSEYSVRAAETDQEPCCQNNDQDPAKSFRDQSKSSPYYSCHIGKSYGDERVSDVKNGITGR